MENKLPEDFKQKWIAALRSGEYKQGALTLRNGDSYCVLGVGGACLGLPMNSGEEIDKVYETFKSMLTTSEMWKIVGMNDDGYSFPKLADYIESNL